MNLGSVVDYWIGRTGRITQTALYARWKLATTDPLSTSLSLTDVNDQLAVGLVAQLLEHCKSIAEVRVSSPVHAGIFQAFSPLLN